MSASRVRRRFRPAIVPIASLAFLWVLVVGAERIRAQVPGLAPFPTNIFDPRLEPLRRASVEWDLRVGPAREVVDQVCLVPDVATFYEAMSSWDERHFFPILIDDLDLTWKFLRAFRPSRVIRFPAGGKLPTRETGETAWNRAVEAVGASWTASDAPASSKRRGDARPEGVGPTPPGVVIGSPRSESLPGLAALAAGRFQPLRRVDLAKTFRDILDKAEMAAFASAVENAARPIAPGSLDGLGDDCDFVTLAGDYPYRYLGEGTALAVDDGIARVSTTGSRWAFPGRLLGDERRSVYAAMCSLFLQPDSALLFNGYAESSPPWTFFSLSRGALSLKPLLPVALVTGDKRATVKGWHEAFDPWNRAGLVLINSSGQPNQFAVQGGIGDALEIPPSVPAIVCMIHSYSAADPNDPKTIAGRWLAQGAYLYFGSTDEPYLDAFRPLSLVGDLLVEGLPIGAAVRTSPNELRSGPWKLALLGDPLYRIRKKSAIGPRIGRFVPTEGWKVYAEGAPPTPDAPEMTRLGWAINALFVRQTTTVADDPAAEGKIFAVLRSIDRNRLDPGSQAILDVARIEILYRANRPDEVRSEVRAIPVDERGPVVTRLVTSMEVVELQRAIARSDFDRACVAWRDLMGVEAGPGFHAQMTGRIAALANTPLRADEWRRRLRSSRESLRILEARDAVDAELKRIGPGNR